MELGIYKSAEEYHFANYLEELKGEGYILEYEYEPSPFLLCNEYHISYDKQLKTKKKKKEKRIKYALQYTVDFKVKWNTTLSDGVFTYIPGGCYDKLPPFLINKDGTSYFEVKPNFDANNMTRAAKIKIAWVYDKYDIHIDLIKPTKLFKKTFYPNSYLLTDTGQSWRRRKVKGKYEQIKDLPNTKTINDYAFQPDSCKSQDEVVAT